MPTPKSTRSPQPPNTKEIELIARIARQDRDAFAQFFGLYAVRVKAFLLRYGTDPSEADDIAQDVMAQVWRRAETYNPSKAAPSTWVFTIARNRRIDRIRKQARAQPIADDPLFQPEPEKDGASILSANQRHQRVRDALEGLSEDQRKVIEASFFLGLSHGKVAEVLEIPLGTVKSRIRLAFTALRKALGEDMQEELNDG